MTTLDAATHNGAIAASTYTPKELSYLLAGRDNIEAVRAREVLGLEVVTEGSPVILDAVQSLRTRGLVTVDDEGDVDLEQSTKVLGFVLGTATDWTRLGVEAAGRVEVLVVLKSPEVGNALILRLDQFGNYQAVATSPGVHGSEIVGTMVTGYLSQGGRVSVSVRRDTADFHSVLVVDADTDAGSFTLTNSEGITGVPTVTPPETSVVDKAAYLAALETQLGA